MGCLTDTDYIGSLLDDSLDDISGNPESVLSVFSFVSVGVSGCPGLTLTVSEIFESYKGGFQ